MLQFVSRLPTGWQAKAVFLLGAVLFVSPWVFFYTSVDAALWDSLMLGGVFMAGAAISIAFDNTIADFVVAIMAIFLMLSARILGFSTVELPNDVVWVVGALVFLTSLGSAITRADRRNAAERASPTDPPAMA